MYIRVVLILGIFDFLRLQRLIWFEINKKKKKQHPQVSSLYLNFNLMQAMQVSHLNNIEFLALNDQFFIPAKVMVPKS